jgi:hypothetical protein
MTGFYAWLRKQRNRDDPVGDLACDAMRDKDFPKAERAVRAHLLKCGACPEAFTALKDALKEYRQQV